MKSDGILRKAKAEAAPKSSEKAGKGPSTEKAGPKPREVREAGPDKVRDKPVKDQNKQTRRETTGQDSASRETRAQGGQRSRNGEGIAKPQRETSKAPSAGKAPPVEKQAKPKVEKAGTSKPEKSRYKESASDAAKAHSSAGGRCEAKVYDVLKSSSKSKDGLPTEKEMKEITDTCAEALGKGARVAVKAEAKGPRNTGESVKNTTTRAEIRVAVINDATGEGLYVKGEREAYSGEVSTRGFYINERENRIQDFENGRPIFEGRGLKGGKGGPGGLFGSFSGGGLPTDGPQGMPSGSYEYNVEHKTFYFNPGQQGWQPSTPADRQQSQSKGRPKGSESPSRPAGASHAAGAKAEPPSGNPKSPRDRPERETSYGQRSKDHPFKPILEAAGKLTTVGEQTEAASSKLAGIKVLQRAPHLQRNRIFAISRSTSVDDALKVVSEASKSNKAMKAFAYSSKRLGLVGTAITVAGIGLDVVGAPAGQGVKVAVSKGTSAVVSGLIVAGAGAAAVLALPVTASATVAVLAVGGASVGTSFAYDAFAASHVEDGVGWLYDRRDNLTKWVLDQLE